jgi:hypothetical protein
MARRLQAIGMEKEGYGSKNNRTFRGSGSHGGITGINVKSRESFRTITMIHNQKGENIMVNFHRFMKFLACLVLATSLMACASTRTHEGTGEYMDDTAITTKVKSAILTEPDLKVLQINVETFKGVVQLSGFVNSRESATKAANVARGVKGVVEVKNDLVVK